MKKMEKSLLAATKKMALSSIKRDANATTCAAIFQPKAPADLKAFSKVK